MSVYKPITVEGLQEKYEFEPMNPSTASKAIADRLAIIRECDCKGYHTEEDLKMMDYLMRVRNTIVDHIIHTDI